MVSRDRSGGRRGFSLTEVLVAIAVFAVLGEAMLTMLGTGATGTARAAENQLATMLAARAMDRLVSAGFRNLVPRPGSDTLLDLTRLGETSEGPAADPRVLSVDGLAYRGQYRIENVDEGLRRITVQLTWIRAGAGQGSPPGTLSVMHYVADPAAGLAVRISSGAANS